MILALRAEQPPASDSRREQAVHEHVEAAGAAAVERLQEWSGPYESDVGPYFYNRTYDFSTWDDPVQELNQELDLRQRILQRCLWDCRLARRGSDTVTPRGANSPRPVLRLPMPSLSPGDATPKSPSMSSSSFFTPRSACSVRSGRSITPPPKLSLSAAASPDVTTAGPATPQFSVDRPTLADAPMSRSEVSSPEPIRDSQSSVAASPDCKSDVAASPDASDPEENGSSAAQRFRIHTEAAASSSEPSQQRLDSERQSPRALRLEASPEQRRSSTSGAGYSSVEVPLALPQWAEGRAMAAEDPAPGPELADDEVVITPLVSPRQSPDHNAPSPSQARKFWNKMETPPLVPADNGQSSEELRLKASAGARALDVEGLSPYTPSEQRQSPEVLRPDVSTGGTVEGDVLKQRSAAASADSSGAQVPAPETSGVHTEDGSHAGHDFELSFGPSNAFQLPQFVT